MPVVGAGHGTHVRQIDVDRGGFYGFGIRWVEPAYQRANEALAARVLALHQ